MYQFPIAAVTNYKQWLKTRQNYLVALQKCDEGLPGLKWSRQTCVPSWRLQGRPPFPGLSQFLETAHIPPLHNSPSSLLSHGITDWFSASSTQEAPCNYVGHSDMIQSDLSVSRPVPSIKSLIPFSHIRECIFRFQRL